MILTAFTLGLISSLHCLGMCGPLQTAVTGLLYNNGKWSQLVAYHFSRIFTYAIMGVIASMVGVSLGLASWQSKTSLLAGLLMLATLFFFYILKFDQKLYKRLFPYISRLRKRLQQDKKRSVLYYSGSGFLNGLLPCGMVYVALSGSLALKSVSQGFVFMSFYGLGTLPLLILLQLGVLSFFKQKTFKPGKVIPVMVIATAVLLILRGMSLEIPYLSPEIGPIETLEAEGCK